MMMSCNCISLYLGRINSPIVGFSLSIFWSRLMSHFGRFSFPVFALYSRRLWLLRFVRIGCSFSGGIPVSFANCLMLFMVFSWIVISMSAVVAIGLNLCVCLLMVRNFLSI